MIAAVVNDDIVVIFNRHQNFHGGMPVGREVRRLFIEPDAYSSSVMEFYFFLIYCEISGTGKIAVDYCIDLNDFR